MSELDAAEKLLCIGFPKLDADLVKLVDQQRHLEGRHYDADGFPVLARAIHDIRSWGVVDQAYEVMAAKHVLRCISRADTPEEGIKALEVLCETGDSTASLLMKTASIFANP